MSEQQQFQQALANTCYSVLRQAETKGVVEIVKAGEISPRKSGYFLFHLQGHLVRIRSLPIMVHNLVVLARHNGTFGQEDQSGSHNLILGLKTFRDQLRQVSDRGCDWYPPHALCFTEASNWKRPTVTLREWLEEHVVDPSGRLQAGVGQRSVQIAG